MIKTPIERAVEICGSQGKLARKIGRSQQLVSWWLSHHRIVSAEDAIKIEHACDGTISRAELRPDIFGEPKP